VLVRQLPLDEGIDLVGAGLADLRRPFEHFAAWSYFHVAVGDRKIEGCLSVAGLISSDLRSLDARSSDWSGYR